MKIVNKTKFETKKFREIELEDIFRWDGRIFMKVSNITGEGYVNSYDFSKSRLTDITGDTKVEFIPSELILHEKGWSEK